MTDKQAQNIRSIIFLVALLAAAVSVSFVTLYVLLISHWHGPFRDMWEIYPFLERIANNTWGWKDLWEAYGYSHRLVVPKLLFIADYKWASASNHLLILTAIFCQFGIVFLMAKALWKKNQSSLVIKLNLLCLIIVFQLSGTLLFNFMHTFDVQWFVCCFFVVAGFYSLVFIDDSAKYNTLVSAVLFAAACWCNFSAMAVWPVWGGILYKNKYKGPLIFTLIALVLVFLFFSAASARIGFDTSSIFGAIKWTFHACIYFPLLYLSNPLSDPDYIFMGHWTIVFSFLSLCFLAWTWWCYLFDKRKIKFESPTLFFSCLALFCFGVSVLTGIGRGYDLIHVEAMRYQNIVLLYWSALFCLLFINVYRVSKNVRIVAVTSAVVVFAFFLICQPKAWNENLLLGRNVARAHLALMMGYSNDVPMIAATVSRSMIYVPGYGLEKERALFEQERKGIYAGSLAAAWLDGIKVSSFVKACEGVQWSIKLKQTPYTEFNELIVSGNIGDYQWALLINDKGRVEAVAELDKKSRVLELFVDQGDHPVMRGYAKSGAIKRGALILGGSMADWGVAVDSASFGSCSSIISPDIIQSGS